MTATKTAELVIARFMIGLTDLCFSCEDPPEVLVVMTAGPRHPVDFTTASRARVQRRQTTGNRRVLGSCKH